MFINVIHVAQTEFEVDPVNTILEDAYDLFLVPKTQTMMYNLTTDQE